MLVCRGAFNFGSMKKVRDPDDLKHDPEIKRTRQEKAAHLLMLRDCQKELITAFNAKPAPDLTLHHYVLFQHLPNAFVSETIEGTWNNHQMRVSFISYYTEVRAGRVHSAGYNDYLAGLITLSEKYPHTIIQPEILRLKIENLFSRLDTDFRHAKLFSFLFYVVTKDKDRLRYLMADKRLNRLNRYLNAEIEIIGNVCYFRANRKAINMRETQKFIRLGKLLAELL